jgi:uroporphyrinogen decarboxylase
MPEHPFLAVLSGRTPSRVPAWIMRQAGRYLPQYRALRAGFPRFTDFLTSPEAAAEATVQPVDALDVDAAILFSDILVVLPPLGLTLEYREGEGPRLGNLLDTEDRIRQIPRFDPSRDTPFVLQAIRLARRALDGRVPLIGFAAAPWTLACYAVDGRGGKEFLRTRSLLRRDPALFDLLLERLSDLTVEYLCAQAEAGAEALQLFESWALLFDADTYSRRILPHTARVVSEVKARAKVPVILYGNGASLLAEPFASTQADALGIDWRIPMHRARAALGNRILQGNLDPAALLGSPRSIADAVSRIARENGGGPWIGNLGHGISPDVPVEHARAFVEAVHSQPL